MTYRGNTSKKILQRLREEAEHTKTPIANLQDMIEIRREELQDIGTHLAKAAKRRSTITSIVKTFVIFLGAIVVARQVAEQILGGGSTIIVVGFTIVGILISVLTGLEAFFKWEYTSAELRSLVATGRTAARKASSDLVETLATAEASEKSEKVRNILRTLDATIGEIQTKSAKLGIDTVVITSVSERASPSYVNHTHTLSLTPNTSPSLSQGTVRCQTCSAVNPVGEAFCSNCGATFLDPGEG